MIQTNLLTLPWLKTPNLGCPKASIIFRLVSQFSWQNMWSSTPYCRLVERNHELNRQIWIWWDPPNCACNAFRSIKSLDMLVQRQRSSYDFFWTMPGCFRDLEPCKFLQGRMERQPAQTCPWGGVWSLSLSKERLELGRPTKKVSVQCCTFFGWWFAVVSSKIHRKKLKQWTFGAFKLITSPITWLTNPTGLDCDSTGLERGGLVGLIHLIIWDPTTFGSWNLHILFWRPPKNMEISQCFLLFDGGWGVPKLETSRKIWSL